MSKDWWAILEYKEIRVREDHNKPTLEAQIRSLTVCEPAGGKETKY